jgi:hypothetical protein
MVAWKGRYARGPQPHVPIQTGGRVARGRRADAVRRHVVDAVGLGHGHLADVAPAHAFRELAEMRTGTPVGAHLHHPLRFVCHPDHPAAFLQRVGEGLLDVDVLARPARVDGLEGVPVVRRGDEDRVDVLVVEKLAVVARGDGLARQFRGPLRPMRLVDVADRHNIDVRVRQRGLDQLPAAVAHADETDPDAFVGAVRAPDAERRHTRRCGARLHESTPADFRHRFSPVHATGPPRGPPRDAFLPRPSERSRRPAPVARNPIV